MLDPSLAALLDHLNWSPPAIVQPAPTEATNRKMSGYAAYVTGLEQELRAWVDQGVKLRGAFWQAATDGKPGFDIDSLSTIIEQVEDGLKREAIVLARKEKLARRTEKNLDSELKRFVGHHQARMLEVGRDFYAEGRDFAAFLRALRAEMDPQSRGGDQFQDAAALEKYLANSLA